MVAKVSIGEIEQNKAIDHEKKEKRKNEWGREERERKRGEGNVRE